MCMILPASSWGNYSKTETLLPSMGYGRLIFPLMRNHPPIRISFISLPDRWEKHMGCSDTLNYSKLNGMGSCGLQRYPGVWPCLHRDIVIIMQTFASRGSCTSPENGLNTVKIPGLNSKHTVCILLIVNE